MTKDEKACVFDSLCEARKLVIKWRDLMKMVNGGTASMASGEVINAERVADSTSTALAILRAEPDNG